MRNYVTIQVATKTSDSQGGGTLAWTNTYYEWVKATPLSQSRTLDEGGIKYRTAVEFEGFYRSDDYTLGPEHRIVWNSTNYTIHSVVNDEKLMFRKILAYA